jgi:hypothetical protein
MSNFLPQPKAGKIGNQTLADGDKQFKIAVACVWVEWLRHYQGKSGANIHSLTAMNNPEPLPDGFGQYHYALYDYTDLQLDHIKNKVHGDRYDLLNAQLVTPEWHDIKTQSGEYTDCRPKEYVTWLRERLK